MKNHIVCILIIVLLFNISYAQELGFFTTVKNDSIHFFLNQTLEIGHGFYIEDESGKRLNETPIVAEMNPINAKMILGNFHDDFLSILKVETTEQLILKLRNDNYYGTIATLMDKRAAKVLGRYYSTSVDKKGKYNIVITNSSGKIEKQVDRIVDIKEVLPKTITDFNVEQKNNQVIATWIYPKWDGDYHDITFQFLLFRSEEKKVYTQVNDRPLFRVDGMSNRYVDTSVEMGKKYKYKIVAIDALGRSGKAAEIKIQTFDQIPPEKPQELVALVEKEKVHLSWLQNSDTDIAGYNIYRWEAESEIPDQLNSKLLPITETQFIDNTMKYSMNYYYGVSAVDLSGNVSKHSARASALVTDKTPPKPASNFSAEIIDNMVKLQWEKSPSDDVAGYFVRRGFSVEHPYKLQDDPIESTNYIDKSGKKNIMKPGQKYYYSVVAVDTMTYQSESIGVWITIPDNKPPQSPGKVKAENRNGREVMIKWNPSISRDVESYKVQRINGEYTILSNEQLSYIDKKIKKGQTVQYKISAIDTAGNESEFSISNEVLVKDVNPPSAPSFVSGKIIESSIFIIWEPVGDFDLVGYNVYRGKSQNSLGEKLNSVPITDLQFIDQSGNKDFKYWIKSVDTSGNESERSIVVTI